MVELLRQEYESILENRSGAMKVHQGKGHKFLGMTLDCSTKSKSMTLWDHASRCIETLKMMVSRLYKTGLINQNQVPPPMTFLWWLRILQNYSHTWPHHSTTLSLNAKALYIIKWSWLDMSLAIAFPRHGQWEKVEAFNWISTADMPLILVANKAGKLEWYVDTSFAVHPNVLWHTGGGLMMGNGFPISTSTKQKLQSISEHHLSG